MSSDKFKEVIFCIYRKHYKSALSHVMKVKIVLREPYFVPLKQKGHILTFSKTKFIKLYLFNVPYLKIIGNLVLKLILLTLS